MIQRNSDELADHRAKPNRVAAESMDASPVRRVALYVFVSVVIVTLAAFVVRFAFVVWSGPFAATTGFEEFCLYNIWKVTRHFPVYEWPQRDHYLLSFYNIGFYQVYGAWTEIWARDPRAIVASARLLTPLFGLLGCMLQVRVVCQLWRKRGGRCLFWTVGLSVLTWFGTAFVGWFAVSARPDVGAVTFALAGLSLSLDALESPRVWRWLAASLAFWVAWSFKQSIVWTFSGVVLGIVSHRGWRDAAPLVLPWLLGVGLTVTGAGATYRYNLVAVPQLFAWFPRQSLALLAQVGILNLFVAIFGVCWVGRIIRHYRLARRDEQVVALGAILALTGGCGQLALRGSSCNNIMEGFVLLSVASTVGWLKQWDAQQIGWLHFVGIAALLLLLPLPTAQLCLASRGSTYHAVFGTSVGNLIKLNSRQLAQRQRCAEWMRTLPKPLWIRDAMLQLPWFATADQYPAFVLNDEFETDARAHHALEGNGFSDWIRRRHFKSLLLRSDDPLLDFARGQGYVDAPVPPEFARFAGEFGLDGPGPRLVVLPGERQP